jgi:diguanylate cyclase (GGDEF)-like protein
LTSLSTFKCKFKRVNDSAGHAAGDAVLVETARRLRQAVREGDTVARVGGDEFVLIIEPWNRSERGTTKNATGVVDGDRRMALGVADRIVSALHDPFDVRGGRHEITVSIGVAFPSAAERDGRTGITAVQIVAEADAAMYRAKHDGKDRFEVFTAPLAGSSRPA